MNDTIQALWFKPARWKNVSVRRQRIAEKLEPKGVSVDLVPATSRNILQYGTQAIRGQYDIVLGNVHMGVFAGFPIAWLSRKPFIAEVTDFLEDIDHLPTPIYAALRRYERFALRHADATIFLPETHDWWYKHHGIDGKIAGNSVDFELFDDPDDAVVHEAGEILNEEGVDLEKPIALYHGTLPEGDRKLEETLEATTIATDWQFVLLGEGPMVDEVERRAGLVDNLFFPGAFEYELMPGFLGQADAGLCIETVERPLKISEFGAANIPTLGAYGKMEREFSEDELFFVETEAQQIADALSTILANPSEAAERAERLREHVKQYSWENVATTYYDTMTSLLES